jgi:uncharacterized protein (DUF433 family)
MSLATVADPTPLRTDADGVIRVGDTRVRLASIVFRYRGGATPEQIHESFPSVPLPDVSAVVAYYLRHQVDVDAYLTQLDAEAQRLQEEVEARPATQALRQALLARRG